MTTRERAVIEAAQAFARVHKQTPLEIANTLTKPERQQLARWIAARQTLLVSVEELETRAEWADVPPPEYRETNAPVKDISVLPVEAKAQGEA